MADQTIEVAGWDWGAHCDHKGAAEYSEIAKSVADHTVVVDCSLEGHN